MHDHAHHDHSHGGHHHGPANYDRAFAIGIGLNILFVIAEAVFGYYADSLALVSDAAHNLSDVFGLLLAWGASRLARTSPTARRTYGLRRSSIMASLANALILLVAVGGIVWEAIRRLAHPEPVAEMTVIIVAGIGILINAGTALLFMSGRDKDINIKGAYLHMAADAAVSVGVVIAGFIIGATGWLWLDPAISIVIGIVITIGTWGLLKESFNLSMDAVPENIDPSEVREYLESLPGVSGMHDLHIWAMSTTETALTAHLVINGPHPGNAFLAEVAEELEHQFSIGHSTLQIETGDGECPCGLSNHSV